MEAPEAPIKPPPLPPQSQKGVDEWQQERAFR